MDINVDLKEKNHAEITFMHEDRAMVSMIRKVLLEDSDVTFAGIVEAHPELPDITLVVKVKKGNPVTMVEKAALKVAKMAEDVTKKAK